MRKDAKARGPHSLFLFAKCTSRTILKHIDHREKEWTKRVPRSGRTTVDRKAKNVRTRVHLGARGGGARNGAAAAFFDFPSLLPQPLRNPRPPLPLYSSLESRSKERIETNKGAKSGFRWPKACERARATSRLLLLAVASRASETDQSALEAS